MRNALYLAFKSLIEYVLILLCHGCSTMACYIRSIRFCSQMCRHSESHVSHASFAADIIWCDALWTKYRFNYMVYAALLFSLMNLKFAM